MKRVIEEEEEEEEETRGIITYLPPEIWTTVLRQVKNLPIPHGYVAEERQNLMGRLMMVDRCINKYMEETYSVLLKSLRDKFCEQLMLEKLNDKYEKSEWFICIECNRLCTDIQHGTILDCDDRPCCDNCVIYCEHCDSNYRTGYINEHRDCFLY